jgi:hypothetical protein
MSAKTLWMAGLCGIALVPLSGRPTREAPRRHHGGNGGLCEANEAGPAYRSRVTKKAIVRGLLP